MSPIGTPPTNDVSFKGCAATDLKSIDFRFVGHANTERIFSGEGRPLRLMHVPPSLEAYEDAIYTPATRRSKPFDGTLYDQNLDRIDATCIRRSTRDCCLTTDALQFDRGLVDLPVYDRPVLYLGMINPHYGHFIVESLARWWPLVDEGIEFDRYLVHVHDRSVLDLPFVQASLAAMNIFPHQLVHFDRPTRLRKVIVPATAFQMDSHVFSRYRTLCERLATGIVPTRVPMTDQPLYISRRNLSAGVTQYAGEAAIEEFLVSRGARVIHPQMMSFEEQVRVINQHKRIIGIIGSGMHNLVFSLQPKTLTYLTPHWINPTCFLIDKCFDVESTYIQACSVRDRFRSLYNRVAAKMFGDKVDSVGPFGQTKRLATKRVIDWFMSSGSL